MKVNLAKLINGRFAPFLLGGTSLVILAAFYRLAGNFNAEPPWYFSSSRAFLGMTLLMILMPSYFVMCLSYSYRRSLELARIADQANKTRLEQAVRQIPVRQITIGSALGVVYALAFNIPGHGLTFLTADSVERAMILGQLLIWIITGGFLAIRITISRTFNAAGHEVNIDLFETSNLRPFAQIGLIDVLVIAGALILSTVQSLDFSFRPDNYVNALFIAIPAACYLISFPMWPIHQRMQDIRHYQLNTLNARISAVSKDLEPGAINQLEVLLQRRERVLATTTWPMDTAIIQRFIFYLIIPPLAWIGAAIVEYLLEQFINAS